MPAQKLKLKPKAFDNSPTMAGAGLRNSQLGKTMPFWVLIVILMIKPYGLFGTRDIERV